VGFGLTHELPLHFCDAQYYTKMDIAELKTFFLTMGRIPELLKKERWAWGFS
jgi:hypothetical protein